MTENASKGSDGEKRKNVAGTSDLYPSAFVAGDAAFQESVFRCVFEEIQEGVAVYEAIDGGRDFRIVGFNRAAERIEKIDRNQVIGREVTRVFPGIEGFGLLDAFRVVLKTGSPVLHPVCWYQDDNIEGWRENWVHRLGTGHIVTIYTDKTAQKQSEQELQSSEKRYRAVVEDLPAMVCRFLPDGTLTFVNSLYCSYFRLFEEEMIGADFFRFIPDAERERVCRHFDSFSLDMPMITYEHQGHNRDGADCWLEWTVRALFDGEELIEYQAIGRDITMRRKEP